MQCPGLISILIPFKNASLYLTDCLDSILPQTYRKWEVIAIDDHSTDNSREIIERYQQTSAKIKCFSNRGKGIIVALQLALEKSSGEFVTRMDSDDMMPREKLQTLIELIQNKPKHIATGQVQYFPKQNISEGYKKYETWLNTLTEKNSHFQEIYKECVIPSPCWLAWKTDLIQAGGFDSEQMPEDYDLSFRFYREKFKVVSTSKLMHHWREHSKRTSKVSSDYSIEKFTQLKLTYFLNLEVKKDDTVVLWSAGKWGKEIAVELSKKKQPFYWVCTNSKKIGNTIYGQIIHTYETVPTLKNPKVIIPIASQKYQTMIKDFFDPHDLKTGKNLFFFL